MQQSAVLEPKEIWNVLTEKLKYRVKRKHIMCKWKTKSEDKGQIRQSYNKVLKISAK